LFLLDLDLFTDFFLDLLHSFQKELFNFTSLVEDDLCLRSDISQIFVLDSQIFTRINNLFTLFFDNRLVLVPDKFLFPFEILHNLAKTFLQNLNLCLVAVDLLGLSVPTRVVLLLSALVNVNIALKVLVHSLQVGDLALVIVNGVTLGDRFLCQLLVFKMDVPFDFLDVSLSVLACLLLAFLQ